MVTVRCRLPNDSLTPVGAFYKLYSGREVFLFESVVGNASESRYSFVGVDPFLHFEVVAGKIRVSAPRGDLKAWLPYENWSEDGRYIGSGDPFDALQSLLSAYATEPDPTAPRFMGGAVGYFGYDVVRFIENLPNPPPDDRHLPDVSLDFYDSVVIFDHVDRSITVTANVWSANATPVPQHGTLGNGRLYEELYNGACERIESLIARLDKPRHIPIPDVPVDRHLSRGFDRSNFDPENSGASETTEASDAAAVFFDVVRRCKEYIAAGDIFQVVISQRFETTTFASPISIYRALRYVNPSPYMFLLRTNGTCLVGSSPELMVRAEDGKITVRPLAGTRRRGNTAEEDEALAADLLSDEKERAEHVMLVDLGRNDVGRVAEYGSVRVERCMEIERYSHVMHISSTVSGKLKRNLSPLDALRACLPAGTVSGAPKVRAMQIIDEMEHSRRGPYAGAVGFAAFDGHLETCLALRTMVISDRIRSDDGKESDPDRVMRPKRVHIQAGAGIVADSVPRLEYQETINKAKAVLKAIEVAEGWRYPMKQSERTVLSCIQPTSDMHIGNYFGAVKNWVALQDAHRCIYGVVDLHAMTRIYDPKELRTNTRRMFVDLLACGIDPEESILFIQSMVPEHTELCWILSCLCALGDLSRMTQFKDKSKSIEEGGKSQEFVSAGLFMYPVLQAADILIYRAAYVPVGKDQEQHLELSREIARRFNQRFGVNFFPEPQPLFSETPKIMSLARPDKKMSKSDREDPDAGGEKSYIGLFEDEKSVRQKVRAAVTDVGSSASGGAMSPGVANLFELLRACDKLDTATALQKDYNAGSLKYVALKDAVADALVELTGQLRRRREEIAADVESVDKLMQSMADRARALAVETLSKVRDIAGLPQPSK
jgi:anthranilate synthase component I